MLKTEEWKQYYTYRQTWPAEEDRMQDMHKHQPDLLRPIGLQVHKLERLGFRVQCEGCGVQGLGSRVEGLGLRVYGSGLRAEDLGSRV